MNGSKWNGKIILISLQLVFVNNVNSGLLIYQHMFHWLVLKCIIGFARNWFIQSYLHWNWYLSSLIYIGTDIYPVLFPLELIFIQSYLHWNWYLSSLIYIGTDIYPVLFTLELLIGINLWIKPHSVQHSHELFLTKTIQLVLQGENILESFP